MTTCTCSFSFCNPNPHLFAKPRKRVQGGLVLVERGRRCKYEEKKEEVGENATLKSKRKILRECAVTYSNPPSLHQTPGVSNSTGNPVEKEANFHPLHHSAFGWHPALVVSLPTMKVVRPYENDCLRIRSSAESAPREIHEFAERCLCVLPMKTVEMYEDQNNFQDFRRSLSDPRTERTGSIISVCATRELHSFLKRLVLRSYNEIEDGERIQHGLENGGGYAELQVEVFFRALSPAFLVFPLENDWREEEYDEQMFYSFASATILRVAYFCGCHSYRMSEFFPFPALSSVCPSAKKLWRTPHRVHIHASYLGFFANAEHCVAAMRAAQ
ncbi:hypothetical protein ACFE04_000012 [Oxalis oulophora]